MRPSKTFAAEGTLGSSRNTLADCGGGNAVAVCGDAGIKLARVGQPAN